MKTRRFLIVVTVILGLAGCAGESTTTKTARRETTMLAPTVTPTQQTTTQQAMNGAGYGGRH